LWQVCADMKHRTCLAQSPHNQGIFRRNIRRPRDVASICDAILEGHHFFYRNWNAVQWPNDLSGTAKVGVKITGLRESIFDHELCRKIELQ